MMTMLQMLPGWIPLVEPMPITRFWLWWIVPMVFLICLTYRALRSADLRDLPRQTLIMGLQVLVFMVAAAVVLYIVTDWL